MFLYRLLVGNTGNRDLLLTGIFGAVKVIACTFFIWVLAERFGRRTLLVSGSAGMAACMLIVALLDHLKPPPKNSAVVTPAGKATVAFIYLDIMIYNCSWGPVSLFQVEKQKTEELTTTRYHGHTSQRSSRQEFVLSEWVCALQLIGSLPSSSPFLPHT